ncbi:MAG: GNAT family N-acetyltransferase [Acidimicrobiales bacterium]
MDVRPLTLDDATAAYQTTATALLLASFTPALLEGRLAAWSTGRSWGAFDDGRLVGHARALDLETTVPGGARVPTAGVTSVGVLPTHTRRGLLRSMLTDLLVDARDRGQVLASLRASQAGIYGRFGFGVAGLCATYEVDGGAVLRADATADHDIRLLEPGEARAVLPSLHERIGVGHVGAVGRLAHWWDNALADLEDPDRASTRWLAVSVDADGRTDGYVDYAIDDDRGGIGTIEARRVVVGALFAGATSPTGACGGTCSASTWWARWWPPAARSTNGCGGCSPTPGPCGRWSWPTSNGCGRSTWTRRWRRGRTRRSVRRW